MGDRTSWNLGPLAHAKMMRVENKYTNGQSRGWRDVRAAPVYPVGDVDRLARDFRIGSPAKTAGSLEPRG